MMTFLKKAAVSLAATSMILAPVAASAAPAAAASFDGLRSASAVDGQSELEGSTSWIIAILALAAVVGGIVLASDNNEDSPTSP